MSSARYRGVRRGLASWITPLRLVRGRDGHHPALRHAHRRGLGRCGRAVRDPQPGHRGPGGQRGQGRTRARRPGRRGGPGRARRRPVAPDAARGTGRGARRDRSPAHRADRRTRRPGGAGERRAGPAGRGLPDRLLHRPPALLRRAGPQLRLRAARAAAAGTHAGQRHRPPRAGGRVRGHRALELPAAAGHVEDRPGAGRGQHDRGQARRAHPADAAGVRQDRAGVRAAARRPERGARRRPGRRRAAGQSPGRAEDRLHRFDGRRAGDHADGRGQYQAADAGAGRQGAEHHPRRRRPGPGRGRHAVRVPDEPGAGVRVGHPGHRGGRRARQVRRPADRAGRDDHRSGTRWTRPRTSARSSRPRRATVSCGTSRPA